VDEQHPAVRLWEAMEARDWETVGALLADDVIVDWPQSGERIRGREAVIRVNAEYPGEWHVTVERLLASGDEAVTEARVDWPEDGHVDRAISWFTLREGLVAHIREWWPDPFAAAEWRAGYVERYGREVGLPE
jgi:ketosteroid isomerase-like protein